MELELVGDDAKRVVALLTDGRLLSVEPGTVEVAHEAPLREWPWLQAWIEEARTTFVQRTIRGRQDG